MKSSFIRKGGVQRGAEKTAMTSILLKPNQASKGGLFFIVQHPNPGACPASIVGRLDVSMPVQMIRCVRTPETLTAKILALLSHTACIHQPQTPITCG